MNKYSTSVDRAEHTTIAEAKKHIGGLPYWAEAISKGGLTQTVFNRLGDAVVQRQCIVEGFHNHKTVSVSDWYSL